MLLIHGFRFGTKIFAVCFGLQLTPGQAYVFMKSSVRRNLSHTTAENLRAEAKAMNQS